MRTAWRMLVVGVVLAGADGCRQKETKAAVPAAPAVAPAAPRALSSAEKFGLPDYSAQAKADVSREQTAELQTRVEQVKVELPARKK